MTRKTRRKTFAEAWAEKERAGFRYGADAIENVRLGWNMCELQLPDERLARHEREAARLLRLWGEFSFFDMRDLERVRRWLARDAKLRAEARRKRGKR